MDILSNEKIKQYFLIVLIIALVIVLGRELFSIFPGILAAFTMYVLMREKYFELTVVKGWKKWGAAVFFIVLALLILVLPIFLLVEMLIPKLNAIIANPTQLSAGLDAITAKAEAISPSFKLDESQIRGFAQRAMSSVPGVLNATLNVFSNLVMALFLLYFMLTGGRRMERRVQEFLPLKQRNIDKIWKETRTMVVSNAIGIPLLAILQGILACVGYALFGIEEWGLWGFVTGVFSIVPIVGTAIIWIPLVVFLFATGHAGQGIGLLIYSIVVVTNSDNVLRFTILRKLGDVHPIVTVFGILAGIPLFGIMGFIFGPLLISYLLLLMQIYRVEFSASVEDYDVDGPK